MTDHRNEAFTETRVRKPVPSYAWKCAYGILGATAVVVLLGAGFFVYGGVFAPLSDAGGALVGLLLVPLVWAMYRLNWGGHGNRLVFSIGIGAATGIVFGSIGLLVMRLFALDAAPVGGALLSLQFLGWVLLGGWLLGVGALGIQEETVARRVSWAAIVSGVGTAGGVVMLVYSYAAGSFTPAFPLFVVLYAVGFLLWAFWLGRELRGAIGSARADSSPSRS